MLVWSTVVAGTAGVETEKPNGLKPTLSLATVDADPIEQHAKALGLGRFGNRI